MSVKYEYYDQEKTKVRFEKYYNETNQLHREGDKPAIIEYYQNGSVKNEFYFINHCRHREGDKPSCITYYPSECGKNGNIKHESYYIYNVICRNADKPAYIDYYPSECGENGNVKYEEYYNNDGDHYREGDKPNQIEYSEDGNTITEIWTHKNGITELKRNVIDLDLEFTKCCRD